MFAFFLLLAEGPPEQGPQSGPLIWECYILSSNWIVSILIFALILGVIVISHEFGHFTIARRNGIRVNEFDVGFGPTLLSKRIGETDFCLKLLPLGGACIFEGMDSLDEEERETLSPDAFPNAPVGARIATVLAGPAANFIIGYIFEGSQPLLDDELRGTSGDHI